MTRKVPVSIMENLRYYQSLYLRTMLPAVKLNYPKPALKELLEFWTSEFETLKFVKPKDSNKGVLISSFAGDAERVIAENGQMSRRMYVAKKGYEDVAKIANRYL